MSVSRDHDVADLSRAGEGYNRIKWAAREMPVLKQIEDRFRDERPPSDVSIGADDATYYDHIRRMLDEAPAVTLDDGADLITTLHRERQDQLSSVLGGTEETTTGVIRLPQWRGLA